jgi:sulfate adenylyltransferase large subunit
VRGTSKVSAQVFAEQDAGRAAIHEFLRRDEEKDLLRFTTAGSVDDGKSTLIGRLLYDSKGVYEDQLAAIKTATVNQSAGAIDFALLTDGLRAEREQGITIDVAYRYFATPKRKFIIADTPGHEQYTRNMATGASTANLAIILIDARNGVLPQSKRHAFIASLLGIQHVLIAVNKMDLVNYDQEFFETICSDFRQFAAPLQVQDLYFIPVSALHGDNVVVRSDRMPWYEGETLLGRLENVHIASDRNLSEMRFPVQVVLRPSQQFRGYGGQVASGVLKVGDPVMVLPSGRTSRVKSIVTYDGELPRAFPPMSVTVCLEDEIDISRGNMLAPPSHPPHVTRCIDARLVWMGNEPLDLRRQYIIKHTTQSVKAQVRQIRYRADVNTLERHPATELKLNEIGAVVIDTHLPLFVDQYLRNRATGSFVLIDPMSNATVAAGMVTGRDPRVADVIAGREAEGLEFNRVSAEERSQRVGHAPALVWLNGGANLAYAVEHELFRRGYLTHVIAAQSEGSVLLEVAQNTLAAGLVTICSADFLYEVERERARSLIGGERFVDIDVSRLDDPGQVAEEVARVLIARGILPSPSPKKEEA